MLHPADTTSRSLVTGTIHELCPILLQALMAVPVVAMAMMVFLLLDPASESTAMWLLAENHPIEMLTFVFLLAGGALGLSLARRARRRGERPLVGNFYLVFSVGLLIAAMEEIAWGQKLLGFETPAFLSQLNRQDETTLHNLPGMHGRTEVLRLAFGLGGLAGVLLSARRHLRSIATPQVLWPWFAVISLHAGIDAYADVVRIDHDFDFLIRHTSELVELLIGAVGFLYVLLNWARLAPETPPAR
jgi:hypothetical protein